ncbi:hypothetical protein [Nitrososphaera sp. AFS]|uniref:hypothetical protein n=1 Tax=Nitrososphaera sp. AFS TaxID=2301191 RepID=UPI00191739CD|nr:hypothetical protein [Nitrososphaera sp. AFS]NAL78759.1 hypothetical protein [Nitrososphaera sp. AFS]
MLKNFAALILLSALVAFILITAATLTGSALAAKKSSSSGTSTSTERSTKTKTTAAVTHVKGIKVLRIHTVPSKVSVGTDFGIRGIVVNNSTSIIIFMNGTCTPPLSVTFNKNAISEPQTTPASCREQQVTLNPGGHSPILNSPQSGITYKASSTGITNATLTFKYNVKSPTSKTTKRDSISRVYSFNILPSNASGTSSTHVPSTLHSRTSSALPPSSTNSQPGTLKAIP